MKYLHTKLRGQVNRFQHENYRLGRANHLLEQRLKGLRELERELKIVSRKQGQQGLSVLMEQLEEYRIIQSEIEQSLQAKIIQTMLDVVIRVDNDYDFVIDKEEVDGLLLRLQSMEGVNFSEANFCKAIAKAGFNVEDVANGGFDLEAVMAVTKNLLDDQVPRDENIFEIKTDHLLPRRS
jgi:hypothetical protein